MKKIRDQIDKIDSQINKLLDERTSFVKEIGKIKEKDNTPIFMPGREKEILERIFKESSLRDDSLPENAKTKIFNEIFSVSRNLQRKLKICYLGPEATFTHLAAYKQFSDGCEYIPVSNIANVFRSVEKGKADFGVVPVENSTEGIVSHTLDVFLNSECKINAELLMNIHHNLLTNESSVKTIETVYSHPQALAQCSIWLEENLPKAKYIEVSSTAEAAKMADSQPRAAAIASRMASSIYGLSIIDENIEDIFNNTTRFFVIGNHDSTPSSDDKTTIMFSIKDRIGALHDMLVPFHANSINLTKIESRPAKTKAWEYVFFVDFSGHYENDKVRNALEELKKNCIFFKVLGSYPRAVANNNV
ncbi:prephenate dehydratase [Elusimicrobiota bacterium]